MWESAGGAHAVKAKIFVLDGSENELPLPLIGMDAFEDLGGKLSINFSKRLVQL